MKRHDVERRGRWNANRLERWAKAFLGDQRLIVVANREPFVRERSADGTLVVRRASGGLVTALEPLVRSCGGVWIARGSEPAGDGSFGGLGRTSPYRVRRVALDTRELQGYYYGFANEALWPLCHRTPVAPVFRSSDFRMYRSVNERFADIVRHEASSDSPLTLVQDYHFALAPQLIRQRLPLARIVTFWHVPWPEPDAFDMCPWGSDVLTGVLGSDIAGFQTQSDCANFIASVEASGAASYDPSRQLLTHDAGETQVRAYPVSIEWPDPWTRKSAPVDVCRRRVRHRLGLGPEAVLAVGVDRMDFTKGIDEKFLAVERFLELHPEFVERFVLAQVAEPSRECLPAYRALRERLVDTQERINARFGTDTWRPIVLLEAHHEPMAVYELFRAADLCYVNSLHDGMNLVAKEFVSARDDEQGVLILSRFAGAAQQLTGALLVNPYAIDDSARALAEAVRMPAAEQSQRMRGMRAVVAESSSYWWASQLLQDASRIPRKGPSAAMVTATMEQHCA